MITSDNLKEIIQTISPENIQAAINGSKRQRAIILWQRYIFANVRRFINIWVLKFTNK